MEGEGTKYTIKKNRLSQVVEKLTVIGNGNVLADKENNNNVTEGLLPVQVNESLKRLFQTPQLASNVSQIQPDAVLPQYVSKFPTSMHTFTQSPSVCAPQIGSTVPDILPILPVSGSTTYLQNILLYGHNDLPPPPLYGVGNPAINLWQFYLNSNNNVPIPSLSELERMSTFPEEIKQEPEDDEGNMVIDEMWTDENGDNSEHLYTEHSRELSLKRDIKTNFPNIIESQKSTNEELPSTSFIQKDTEAVSQNCQAVLQSFIGKTQDNMSHIPVPTMPAHSRSIATLKVKDTHTLTLKKEMNQMMDEIEPKSEITNRFTDTESESSWMGSNPSLQTSTESNDLHQQSPLDLSVKGSLKLKIKKPRIKPHKRVPCEFKRSPIHQDSVLYPEVRGDVASPTTRESVAARYNMDVSPVVEQMPAGSDTAWACPVCGQLFSKKDRLSKHVACRHRGPSSSKTHVCWSCNRAFSRSDMLTRHLRLHTGQKPYRCEVCGQIFSRSDHLATHRRTHTGEKPYKCPQCSYSACRRDMITRHMRTHRTSASKSPSSTKLSPTLSTA